MSFTVLHGDAIEKLRELPSDSAQCCVTSPPYWGLRDYGTATWEGGYDESCNHIERTSADYHKSSTLGPNRDGLKPDNAAFKASERQFLNICGKCGAKRIDAQIGLEDTPDAYVAKIVDVFREVRRVLKNDGTLWMNLGDSYSGNGGYSPDAPSNLAGSKQSTQPHALQGIRGDCGLRPKNLIGIPWRVAFALQADGWYLRSDIIWHKPNPMPESVTDRPTKAHEYLFLLTKSERYFYDADAIREPLEESSIQRSRYPVIGDPRAWRMENAGNGPMGHVTAWNYNKAGRNKRTVWTIATAPYSEAHFATYPPDLIKPCILAGTKAGDIVLDPFAGSGTTGMVAIELGRKAILVELNAEYIPLIEQRCNITPGLPL